MIAGLVLAAGEGRRFGGPKQLAELDGRPLLEHAVAAMAGVGAISRVVVVLGARADEIGAGVDLGRSESVVCAEWAEGQAASLRCGLGVLDGPDLEAVAVTLGDQPRITPQVIAMVLDEALAGEAPAARAVYHGRPGHPVVVRRAMLPQLLELRGDVGAREVLATSGVREVEASHLCSALDVDTPEALEELRAGR